MAAQKDAARTPMSRTDTAWFRMEEPENRMMITGILTFGAAVDYERLRATVEHRLLRFDRFRQRVAGTGRLFQRPRWEEDPAFDLEHHLARVQLPAPAQKPQLQRLVSRLMSEGLDFDRPLWQFHFVGNYAEGGALIVRLHHCIADGIALIHVLLSLADETPDAAPHEMLRWEDDAGLTVTGNAHHASPPGGGLAAQTVWAARLGGKSAAAAGRLIGRWPDPKTRFKGPLVEEKRAAWSERLPLADVKAVGRTLGGTVNDVLVTAMTGALHRYLAAQGRAPRERLRIRAAVPVNLRPPGESYTQLGNRFGLVFLALPVGLADPARRLAALKKNMDALKGTPEAFVAYGILQALGTVPKAVQKRLVTFISQKITAVATNVPGPQTTLFLAGAPITSIVPWVPQAGRAALGISIFSYDGGVWIGLATDARRVPDPQALINAFYEDLAAMRACVPPAERAGAAEDFLGPMVTANL